MQSQRLTAQTISVRLPPEAPPRTTPLTPELVSKTPVAIQLCRYRSVFTRPRLERCAHVSSRAIVRDLVRQLNLLPTLPRGAVACPDETGARIDAHMIYRGAPQLVVHIGISGCRVVWTKKVVRSAAYDQGQRLTSELERLTSARR